ncbi:hypothetical protein PG993_003151 [Apiospora rasikravindrae]|uniref:Major facilitator superfamily transporter n=1 Tax=Apiospora rasikravindrae TaxID=990691 RepID=A0ABR1TYN7_9PEZI
MSLSRKSSIASKADHFEIEEVPPRDATLEKFTLLKDKTEDELKAVEKSLVRKLDWKFLPMVTAMLLMNYLDRINVSNARLAGMQRDCHMTDVQWSAGISLFYVGYIISQVPANIMVAKGKPRYLMPCFMLAWSAVTISMTALNSAWGFMLCRFLVGVTEGPFIPAVSPHDVVLSESPLRMSIWHAGNVVSNIISGLLAAAVLQNMNGIRGLASWRWFVLIEGAVSIAIGVAAFWFMPNFPSSTGTYFMSAEEVEMAQYRQEVNAGGISEDDEGGHWEGVRLALKEPFTWLFASSHFFIIIGQSFKDFLPSIMNTFGFSKTNTYLLQAPPYVFAYMLTIGISWSSGRRLEHCWHMVGSMALCLAGAVIMISTLSLGPPISWETAVVPRPRTKRAALIAIANCVSSVSHWFTPYFFLRRQEPRYQTGGGVIVAGCGLAIVSCIVTRWWCVRKNKEIEKRENETSEANAWRFVT